MRGRAGRSAAGTGARSCPQQILEIQKQSLLAAQLACLLNKRVCPTSVTDQQACLPNKRVCPTNVTDQQACLPNKRVCPTNVTDQQACLPNKMFASQLLPQKLKDLNPLLACILIKKLGCLPNIFFLSSKLRCFTWNFGA